MQRRKSQPPFVRPWIAAALLATAVGCQSSRSTRVAQTTAEPPIEQTTDTPVTTPAERVSQVDFEGPTQLPTEPEGPPADSGVGNAGPVGGEPGPSPLPSPTASVAAEPLPAPVPESPRSDSARVVAPTPAELTESVRRHYPLIREAVALRTVASGEALAAAGAFDHKLEGYSNSQPLDFYENHWHNVGVKRDTFWGGEAFAGYRIGRGSFEPWYLERETNDGGEFKAGVVVPLAQDRGIDANRAELWRSQIERERVEPEIRAVLIGSVRDAQVAYWQWVGSAEAHRIALGVLALGRDRQGYLERQVELGEKAEIELVDNRRIVLSRSAKVTDARRKLDQSAVKLSLFWRDAAGQPIVTPFEAADVRFPDAASDGVWGDAADVAFAQANRPELAALRLAREQLSVLLSQAGNEARPLVDAGVLVAQDVGQPTSSKRDKSELELEATLAVSVPLERRKAQGKARQLRGKIAQLQAKMRLATDKITAEAQAAHAALVAAGTRVDQTTESLALAERMLESERRLYELGQSTLFNLNLREQQTAEAAIDRMAAMFDYHVAAADYAAALGAESVEGLARREPAPAPPG